MSWVVYIKNNELVLYNPYLCKYMVFDNPSEISLETIDFIKDSHWIDNWFPFDFASHKSSQVENIYDKPLKTKPLNRSFQLDKPKQLQTSITNALQSRRSIRKFSNEKVLIDEISIILFFSAHVMPNTKHSLPRNDPNEVLPLSNDFFPYPTAGTYNALSIYIWSKRSNELPMGLYLYDQFNHQLNGINTIENDFFNRFIMNDARWTEEGALILFIVGDISKRSYNHRYRLLHLEAGHLEQNIQLVTSSINLGSCPFFNVNETLFLELSNNKVEEKILLSSVIIGHKE